MPNRTLATFVTTGLVATGLVLAAGAAMAQSPSADSIINSLTPRTGGGLTRGIRPLAPAAPASQAPADNTTPAVAHPTARPMARPATPAVTTARPATTPPPAQTGAATEATTQPPSVNLTVQFPNGSAELTPAAMRTLDELGRALSSDALAKFHFRIEGHTDTVGAPDHNQTLSERRAQAVVAYISSKYHVDAARLEPVGMGESHLLVPTGQNVAEPRNRRVTVVNVGA